MFEKKNVYHYLFAFSLILVASYVGNRFKQSFSLDHSTDEYELIRKYLLNDSPLYGYNKPKIWIHSKYEINAREWLSFQSRNTTNLNQPYLHLTIQSIIDHCGKDFHICLIDDTSFSKLIPTWDVDISNMAEPFKSRFRELALLELVYFYGGMIVPNSFVCSKSLRGLYEKGTSGNSPFVCEAIQRTSNVVKEKRKMLFVPDVYFMGANKNNEVVLELVEYLKQRNKNNHFQNETEFTGETSYWCINSINNQKMNLIGGELIGIKNKHRKQILLDDIMEEKFLEVDNNCYGIYIPMEEVLSRKKFQWFAVLSRDELLKSNLAVIKYLKASMVDAHSEYFKDTTIPSSVVSL
jgi:hypothetical protein